MRITVQIPDASARHITAAVGLTGTSEPEVTAAVQEWADETIHQAKIADVRRVKATEADAAISGLGESPRERRQRLRYEQQSAAVVPS